MSHALRKKILICLKIATWVSYINLSGKLNNDSNLFLWEVNNCPFKWHMDLSPATVSLEKFSFSWCGNHTDSLCPWKWEIFLPFNHYFLQELSDKSILKRVLWEPSNLKKLQSAHDFWQIKNWSWTLWPHNTHLLTHRRCEGGWSVAFLRFLH